MSEFHAIELAEEELHLHGAKMIWLPKAKLLCAADIHFEKGSFFSRFATLLPPYDTDETIKQLQHWVGVFKPEIFVALGDSFHDARAAERLGAENHELLLKLVRSVPRWIWITGNHDPAISDIIPGERCETFTYNALIFLHELNAEPGAQISGHYHPKASLMLKGQRIAAPCFLRDREKLILPSFGTFTGGLDVDSLVLSELINPVTREIYLAYRDQVFAVHKV